VEEAMARLKCREMKEGESMDASGGQKSAVTAELLEELKFAKGKLVIVSMNGVDMPTPFTVYDIDGAWKIDAGQLIAARMAVKKLSDPNFKKQKEKTEKSDGGK
jgi:hypothetical protein